MKEIVLTKGQVALVDDEDFERLNSVKWHARKKRNTFYALRCITVGPNNKRKTQYMHQMLIECPEGMETDHVDGNGLNNQKDNLRIVTKRQNQQNRHCSKKNKYPGVRWRKDRKKWEAGVHLNGRTVYLGRYDTDIEAFRAYYDYLLHIDETVLGFDYPSSVS